MPTTYDLLHFNDANGTTTFPNDNASGDTWSAIGPAINTNAYYGGFVASIFPGNTGRQLGAGDTTTDGGVKASGSRTHTGTFCHEFWFRSGNVAFLGCHWSIGDTSSSTSLSLWQNADGSLYLQNGTTTIGTSAAGALANFTNYCISILRNSSNQIKVNVDGATVLTVTLSGTLSGVRAICNCLASGAYGASHYGGRYDEYRGTDGDDRYTSFPYTPVLTEFVLDYVGGPANGISLANSNRGPRFARRPMLNRITGGYVPSSGTTVTAAGEAQAASQAAGGVTAVLSAVAQAAAQAAGGTTQIVVGQAQAAGQAARGPVVVVLGEGQAASQAAGVGITAVAGAGAAAAQAVGQTVSITAGGAQAAGQASASTALVGKGEAQAASQAAAGSVKVARGEAQAASQTAGATSAGTTITAAGAAQAASQAAAAVTTVAGGKGQAASQATGSAIEVVAAAAQTASQSTSSAVAVAKGEGQSAGHAAGAVTSGTTVTAAGSSHSASQAVGAVLESVVGQGQGTGQAVAKTVVVLAGQAQGAGQARGSATAVVAGVAQSTSQANNAAAPTPAAGLSAQHAAWLECLARLHGLIDPLVVDPTSRGDGTVVQIVDDAGGTATLTTSSAPTGAPGDSALTSTQAGWLEALVRLHGLIDPLVVTPNARGDGTVTQRMDIVGDAVTVTRLA